MRSSLRAPTPRASATAISWAGTCRGTRPGTRSTKLLVGREVGLFHLVCYMRDGDRVFETYWTTRRGVEAMDTSLALMDLTVFGRRQEWEDSPPDWPALWNVNGDDDILRIDGRPRPQWSRLEAGFSDDLGTGN